MRIKINIPDELMAELFKSSKASSKTEAILIALKEWVNYKRIQKLKSLRGKLEIDMDINGLRNEEIKELNRVSI